MIFFAAIDFLFFAFDISLSLISIWLHRCPYHRIEHFSLDVIWCLLLLRYTPCRHLITDAADKAFASLYFFWLMMPPPIFLSLCALMLIAAKHFLITIISMMMPLRWLIAMPLCLRFLRHYFIFRDYYAYFHVDYALSPLFILIFCLRRALLRYAGVDARCAALMLRHDMMLRDISLPRAAVCYAMPWCLILIIASAIDMARTSQWPTLLLMAAGTIYIQPPLCQQAAVTPLTLDYAWLLTITPLLSDFSLLLYIDILLILIIFFIFDYLPFILMSLMLIIFAALMKRRHWCFHFRCAITLPFWFLSLLMLIAAAFSMLLIRHISFFLFADSYTPLRYWWYAYFCWCLSPRYFRRLMPSITLITLSLIFHLFSLFSFTYERCFIYADAIFRYDAAAPFSRCCFALRRCWCHNIHYMPRCFAARGMMLICLCQRYAAASAPLWYFRRCWLINIFLWFLPISFRHLRFRWCFRCHAAFAMMLSIIFADCRFLRCWFSDFRWYWCRWWCWYYAAAISICADISIFAIDIADAARWYWLFSLLMIITISHAIADIAAAICWLFSIHWLFAAAFAIFWFLYATACLLIYWCHWLLMTFQRMLLAAFCRCHYCHGAYAFRLLYISWCAFYLFSLSPPIIFLRCFQSFTLLLRYFFFISPAFSDALPPLPPLFAFLRWCRDYRWFAAWCLRHAAMLRAIISSWCRCWRCRFRCHHIDFTFSLYHTLYWFSFSSRLPDFHYADYLHFRLITILCWLFLSRHYWCWYIYFIFRLYMLADDARVYAVYWDTPAMLHALLISFYADAAASLRLMRWCRAFVWCAMREMLLTISEHHHNYVVVIFFYWYSFHFDAAFADIFFIFADADTKPPARAFYADIAFCFLRHFLMLMFMIAYYADYDGAADYFIFAAEQELRYAAYIWLFLLSCWLLAFSFAMLSLIIAIYAICWCFMMLIDIIFRACRWLFFALLIIFLFFYAISFHFLDNNAFAALFSLLFSWFALLRCCFHAILLLITLRWLIFSMISLRRLRRFSRFIDFIDCHAIFYFSFLAAFMLLIIFLIFAAMIAISDDDYFASIALRWYFAFAAPFSFAFSSLSPFSLITLLLLMLPLTILSFLHMPRWYFHWLITFSDAWFRALMIALLLWFHWYCLMPLRFVDYFFCHDISIYFFDVIYIYTYASLLPDMLISPFWCWCCQLNIFFLLIAFAFSFFSLIFSIDDFSDFCACLRFLLFAYFLALISLWY